MQQHLARIFIRYNYSVQVRSIPYKCQKIPVLLLLILCGGCEMFKYEWHQVKYQIGLRTIATYQFDCTSGILVRNIERQYDKDELSGYPATFNPVYKSIYPYFDLQLIYKGKLVVFVYRLYGDEEIISTSKTSMLVLKYIAFEKTILDGSDLSGKEKKELRILFQEALIKKLPYYCPGSHAYPEAGR
jgi:hypothetical protein